MADLEGVSERTLSTEETMRPGSVIVDILNTVRNISIKKVGNKTLKLLHTSSQNYMFVSLLIKKQISIQSATKVLNHPVF